VDSIVVMRLCQQKKFWNPGQTSRSTSLIIGDSMELLREEVLNKMSETICVDSLVFTNGSFTRD